ncbi:MAG: hypothetical protein RLZZ597_40 [Cyanobacteriota bacterium]|jgi:hypothetical protein
MGVVSLRTLSRPLPSQQIALPYRELLWNIDYQTSPTDNAFWQRSW